jgi:NDP-sugar pyrophosphorylase family protein
MKHVAVIPMAGKGLRFVKDGFKTPKPLIQIDNEYMFVKVCKSIPRPDKWIFIYDKDIDVKYNLEQIINSNFDNALSIKVIEDTGGQAQSCKMAYKYLDDDDFVFISSCDIINDYNLEKLSDFKTFYDIQVFTSNKNSFAYENPEQFGWVYSKDSIVKNITCKKSLPNNLKGSIIVGAFIFSKAQLMLENILLMEKNQKKINNEYYMDMSLIEALKNNYTIFEKKCKNFYSVGTPKELDIYLSSKKK